ncbi:lamin tail domain-containing protein [Granulicella sp. dw_53]|uniref:lamin tail domain-containing protein n=1 Tax=Granulicella sp. dw_53 TaxID=2719792 RepID=UPI001BD37F04|nr:lamin tail domain-containing protein [Granulicella sp. dw_53]
MTPHRLSFRPYAFLLALFSALGLLSGTASAATETSVVISQVYGGGGNSGATYKNDFIELFNPTAAPVSLAGYSVQYASGTGTSYQVTALPSFTLQPGQYFLIQEAVGANGTTNLPTPDASASIAMSATAGKVALVSSTTALSGTSGCPTSAATVLDYIGYGGTATAANCSLGSPAPALTNSTAAIRTNVCTPTNNNASDFATGAPVPHNSASTLAPCGGNPGNGTLAATALATPSSTLTGAATLLTASVTPATSPASTGIQVSADLSAAGGSASQPFYDDGTHGDATSGDNVFSYSFIPTTAGTFSLPITVSDTQLRSASASIALTTTAAPSFVSIRTIQANKPSTYATQTVTTSGLVIGVKSNGFYLEAKDADTNPVTPEGILVYTGSTALPSFIQVGAEVQVTGLVATYPTTGLTPGTEIDGPQTFTLLTSGNPLPTPIKITAAMDSPSGGVKQFSKYEGMRVAIDSFTTTSGTDANLTETTETNTSNGRFYGVVTGIPRPFREPGVSVMDTLFGPIPATVPVWDSNPEILYIDSFAFGGGAIDLTSNTTLTGLVGVMDFSFGTPEILLDKTSHPSVSPLMTAQPVPAQTPAELTIASFNMERFYNDKADSAGTSASSAVVVTTAAYQRRLAKASLAVRNILNSPDIIGAEEIENLAVLNDLTARISSDASAASQPDPAYVPCLIQGNDIGGINVAFLVKSTRVNTLRCEQFGKDTTFTNAGGAQAILNDRPPLVLHAGVKRVGGTDYPVTVIAIHQRSLINVDDPTNTGATVRLKREAQAEFVANLIQGYQSSGEHVVTVGDYNAFEFSDGFVDALGVIKGNPVPASQVITPPVSGLANPVLVDLVTLLPAEQRQSYVEVGSAQVLDHVVVTSDLVPSETRLVYAHMDSDFPLVYLNDATRPERVSDHDPAVVYLSIPPAAVAGSVSLSTTASLTKVSGGYQAVFTVKNSGTGTAQNVQLTSATLGSASGMPIPQPLGNIAPGASATGTVTFPAAGATSVEKYSGTYTGGTFSGSIRATLPQ